MDRQNKQIIKQDITIPEYKRVFNWLLNEEIMINEDVSKSKFNFTFSSVW